MINSLSQLAAWIILMIQKNFNRCGTINAIGSSYYSKAFRVRAILPQGPRYLLVNLV